LFGFPVKRQPNFKAGDGVVYYKSKKSPSPSLRAQNLRPQKHGEEYSYVIKKYWTVLKVDRDELIVATRRGKYNRIKIDDPRLHKISLLEKILYFGRFPKPPKR
jgi:hypothetical protein